MSQRGVLPQHLSKVCITQTDAVGCQALQAAQAGQAHQAAAGDVCTADIQAVQICKAGQHQQTCRSNNPRLSKVVQIA